MSTVEEWLNGLDLGKYAEVFTANDVDFRALPHLDSADLQELGVSLGHRKILLKEIAQLREAERRAHPPAPDTTAAAAQPEPRETEAPGEPTPDLRLLSVLFCDMVGSTTLSSQLNAEEMHDLITLYQDTVAGAVTRFGGYVAKFLGDGVLVYFGWPLAYEDHAERAIRAGIAAVAGVAQLKTMAGAPLRARVGIATGRVVVGDLARGGVLDRGQVAGDTPNLASRLQSIAEPGQVVIGESTRRLAGHAFEFEALGTRELKGFEDRVAIFAVRSESKVETRFDAARGDALSTFVGRTSEIGLLLDRWELAKSGQGQVAFVSGEAGIGKSRLIEALLQRIAEEPHEAIRLQCSPYHTTSAFYPVIRRLSWVAGLAPDDDALARAEKLQALLATYGEDPATCGPVYAELLSLELGESFEMPELPAQERKELTLRTIANRPFLAARRAPVILVVEDAHWVDPSTGELLREVVNRMHGAAIYVVVTHRPEWSADWTGGHPHVTNVTLGRLTAQQMRELIEARLEGVSNQLVERIAARTDGVPLFIEELTRSILESGEASFDHVNIPESLQGSLMARLDRLPLASREVAQIASVIGREFDRSLLAEIVRCDPAVLDTALRQLLAAQLVVMSGVSQRSLLFRHALIQDTAYQSLLSRKRRQYHHAIADAIVRSHPNLVSTQPELVARHYTEADCTGLALPYWKRAGERALERSANYEAVDHFRNALGIAEQLPPGPERSRETLATRLLLGEAYKEAGHLIPATVQFQTAAEEARGAGDIDSFLRASLGFDAAQFLSGMPLERSVALLTEAQSATAPGEDSQRCQILTRLARAHLLIGDVEASGSFAEQALKLARRLDDGHSLFDLLANRHLVPRLTKSLDDAALKAGELDELMQLSQKLNSADSRSRAISFDIYGSAELGDRGRTNRALVAMTELGEQRLVAQWIARHGAALLAILDGDFAAAEARARDALTIGRQCIGEQAEGVYGIQMFSIRREQGRLAEVAPVLKRLMEESPHETTWLPGFALIAADLGFADPARRRLHELAETGFEMPLDAKRSASLSYVAEVATLLQDEESAARLYDLISGYRHMTITTGVATVCYGSASRYLGMLATVLGEFDTAEQHFEHALEMNAAMGARPWLAHTKAEYALLLRRRGRVGVAERAERLANEAWEIAAELDMVRLKQRLQANLH